MDHPLKLISYLQSLFFLFCFIMELGFIYYYTNKLYKKEYEMLTKFEKQLSDILYEGLDMESVKQWWWVRNFNLIFTGRFVVVTLLIYNLQYLQVIQVTFSLAIIFGIFMFTLVTCNRTKFFHSKFTKVFRIIQGSSFTIILTLINVFYVDSELKFIKNENMNYYMVILFAVLVMLNILLEIINAFKELFQMAWSKCRQKERQKVIQMRKAKISEFINEKSSGRKQLNSDFYMMEDSSKTIEYFENDQAKITKRALYMKKVQSQQKRLTSSKNLKRTINGKIKKKDKYKVKVLSAKKIKIRPNENLNKNTIVKSSFFPKSQAFSKTKRRHNSGFKKPQPIEDLVKNSAQKNNFLSITSRRKKLFQYIPFKNIQNKKKKISNTVTKFKRSQELNSRSSILSLQQDDLGTRNKDSIKRKRRLHRHQEDLYSNSLSQKSN